VDEFRFGPDRRQFARGGRRTTDPAGYAPMVVVIDDDATRLDLSEAILAKLRFAVAPFATVEKAIKAMHALRPEIVVARADAVDELRHHLPVDRDGHAIPLLPLTAALTDPNALVEALRQVIGQLRAQVA
jgi:FixJ family two-component response regulator